MSGPAVVRPGKIVSFVARGFRPGDSIGVVLQPTARAACCAARPNASFRVASSGTAILRFAMPTTYQRCSTTISGACRRIAWKPGEAVTMTVTGYLTTAKTTFSISSPNE